MKICMAIVASAALIVGMLSCGKSDDKKTNRELFEQYKAQNINAYVGVATQTGMMDEAAATVYADSLMNYLYAQDSTYVRLPNDEVEQFVRDHSAQAIAHCDSIFGRTNIEAEF